MKPLLAAHVVVVSALHFLGIDKHSAVIRKMILYLVLEIFNLPERQIHDLHRHPAFFFPKEILKDSTSQTMIAWRIQLYVVVVIIKGGNSREDKTETEKKKRGVERLNETLHYP